MRVVRCAVRVQEQVRIRPVVSGTTCTEGRSVTPSSRRTSWSMTNRPPHTRCCPGGGPCTDGTNHLRHPAVRPIRRRNCPRDARTVFAGVAGQPPAATRSPGDAAAEPSSMPSHAPAITVGFRWLRTYLLACVRAARVRLLLDGSSTRNLMFGSMLA